VIVSSIPGMPGPISIDPSPDPNRAQDVSLTLADSDLGDTLRVRVFRDYDAGNTLTVGSQISVTPSGKEERTGMMKTTGWCSGASQTGTHQFDVVVSDREWDDMNINAMLPNRTPKANGKTSVRSWVAQCTPSP
jgi:hypothetical protein